MLRRVDLGGFALAQPLGSGGMGVVWRAHHADRRLDAAVKVVSGRDERSRLGLEAEIRAAAELWHPNVVRLYDVGRVGADAATASDGRLRQGDPWVAMELLDGGPLGSLGEWPAMRVALRQLLGALAHAHAHGFVHCDLKPDNVLLAHDGRAVLTDFGVARRTDGPHPNARAGGSPRWMAPEQATADDDATGGTGPSSGSHTGRRAIGGIGPWTDLYALGLLGWWLAAGEVPYPEATPELLGQARAERPLPPLVPRVAVPAGFAAWLRRLARKDPGQRFRRAADALAALVALPAELSLAPDDPGEPIRPAWTATPPPLAPRHPAPSDWRALMTEAPRPLPAELGLGLVSLRQLPPTGRLVERDRLWVELVAGAAGDARLVLLEGPAGAGKTTLARWLADIGHAAGLATPVTAAPEPGADVVRALVTQAVGAGRAGIRAALEERGVPDPDAVEALITGEDPLARLAGRRHDVALAALRACAEGRLLLIVIDDPAHDPGAASFVRRALDVGGPLVVVMTVRTGDETEPLAALAPRGTRIRIEPMADAEIDDLLGASLPLRPDLAREVVARSEGIPLVAVQLVRDWVDRGILARSGHRFQLAAGAVLPLPLSLAALWQDRVQAALADAPARWLRVLELAATLGRTVDRGEWEAAARFLGLEVPPELVPRLTRFALTRPDRRLPRDRWSFAHGLLPQSLLEAAPERRELERACARALVGRRGTAERRARHLEAAGDREEAVEAWLAARSEVTLRDSLGAFALAERAVALSDGLPARTRTRALLARADAHRLASRFDQWYRELAALLPGIERVGDPTLEAELLSALAWSVAERQEPGAEGLAMRVEALLPRVEGPVERFLILMQLSVAWLVLRDNVRAEPILRASVDAAPTPARRGQQLGMLAWAVGEQGRLPEARALMEEARPLVAGAPGSECQWHYNYGNILYAQGEVDAALAALRTAVELRVRMNSDATGWIVSLARYEIAAGDPDAAERTLLQLSHEQADDPRVLVARVLAALGRRRWEEVGGWLDRLERGQDAHHAGFSAGRSLEQSGDQLAAADPALARRLWGLAAQVLARHGEAVDRLTAKLG